MGKLGSTDTSWCCNKVVLTFLTVYVYSPNLEFGESFGCILNNKSKYNLHNVKNSYHSKLFTSAVSSKGVFFCSLRFVVEVSVYFFEELLESLGYCSLRSVLWCLFTFFEELLSMLCCLLLASSKDYLVVGSLGLLGSFGLLGSLGLLRGDLYFFSFLVSINRLEVYE